MLTLLRLAGEVGLEAGDVGGITLPQGTQSMCRLATGRSAIAHMITRLPKGIGRIVLLPCYIAEGVIKPFVVAGFQVHFYRLTVDLQPDEQNVAELVHLIRQPVVFFLIHYFGYPANSPKLMALLREVDALVVSDCAQALLTKVPDGQTGIGDVGDVALYSLNKWLPVTDGALLTSRLPELDLSLDEDALPELPAVALKAFTRHLEACRKLFDSPNPELASRYLGEIGECYEEYYRCINDDMSPHRQSEASRRVEHRFPYAWTAAARQQHTARLAKVLAYHDVMRPLWDDLPGNVVLFAFPVRVPAGMRAAVKSALFQEGVLASTLCDKWDFVPKGIAQPYDIERAFLNEHLLLPVNEFLSDADLSLLERAIGSIQLRNWPA